MQITNVSVANNFGYEDTVSESVKSLNLTCKLTQENPQNSDISDAGEADEISDVQEEEKTPEEKAAEEKAAQMQEIIMSTMIAQYRIEVMLGGDPDDETNPMYVPEW